MHGSKTFLFSTLVFLVLTFLACEPTISPTATLPEPTKPLATVAPSATLEPTITSTVPIPTATIQVFAPAPAQLHPGDPIQLDEIHMTSLAEGWGLSGPYVLVTNDGGQSWREVTPPESLPSGSPDKVYGIFLDRQNAWVIFSQGNQILPEASVWHTTDGGLTWVRGAPLFHQAYGDAVWAEFSVLDSQHIWLMIRGVYVGAGTHHDHNLFRSTDGGLTWTYLPSDYSDDYTGMVFADADNGFRTLETVGAYAGGPPDYEITIDGGANWEVHQLPAPPERPGLFDEFPYCETFSPLFTSPPSVWMLMGCFDYYYPPHEWVSYLYTSTDGGSNWQSIPLGIPVQASSSTLVYFDTTHALLLGHDNYESPNNGHDWNHLSTVYWDGQFSFVDPTHGWAVAVLEGDIGLVKTVNGCVNWILLHPVVAE